MNYSQLVIAIQDYTENQFPTTYLADGSIVTTKQQIDRFIEQAEQRHESRDCRRRGSAAHALRQHLRRSSEQPDPRGDVDE